MAPHKIDRKGYWWVKLPIVSSPDLFCATSYKKKKQGNKDKKQNEDAFDVRYVRNTHGVECWNDAFEPLDETKTAFYNNFTLPAKENFSVSDCPLVSIAQEEQQLDTSAYLLLPLCKIPRQSFVKGDPQENHLEPPKVAHLIPYRPTSRLYQEINKCRIWLQAGVPYYALLAYYAGFVVPEREGVTQNKEGKDVSFSRVADLPVEDPDTHEKKTVHIYLMFGFPNWEVEYSKPFEVFADTCKLNDLSEREARKFFQQCHGRKVWQSLLQQRQLPQQSISVEELLALQREERKTSKIDPLPCTPPLASTTPKATESPPTP